MADNLSERFSKYRLMWVIVMFDLHVFTKKQRKEATRYRKSLLEDGFIMFQYSIYVRNCASVESARVHEQRATSWIPADGKVFIFTITDKQFENIKIYEGDADRTPPPPAVQLELF